MESTSGTFLLISIQAVFGFIQVLLALVAWLGKRALDRIESEQKNLIAQVQFTNGTVIRLEQSNTDHHKMDDIRFEDLERRVINEEKRR